MPDYPPTPPDSSDDGLKTRLDSMIRLLENLASDMKDVKRTVTGASATGSPSHGGQAGQGGYGGQAGHQGGYGGQGGQGGQAGQGGYGGQAGQSGHQGPSGSQNQALPLSKQLLEELKKDPEACREIWKQLQTCEDSRPLTKKDLIKYCGGKYSQEEGDENCQRRRCKSSSRTDERVLDVNDLLDAWQRAMWGGVLWGFPGRLTIRAMN